MTEVSADPLGLRDHQATDQPVVDDPATRRLCRRIYGVDGGRERLPLVPALRAGGPGSTAGLAALGLLLVADAAVGASAIWVTTRAGLSLGSVGPTAAVWVRPFVFPFGGVAAVWILGRWPVRKALAAGAALGEAALMVAAAFSGNAVEFVLSELAVALLSGAVIAAALPMLIDAARPEVRLRTAGAFGTAVLGGAGLSAVVLAVARIGGLTWRATFLILAALPALAAVAVLRVREPELGRFDRSPIRRLVNERLGDDPAAADEDFELHLGARFARVVGSLTAVRILLGGAAFGFGFWGTEANLPTFLRDRWAMGIDGRELLLGAVALGASAVVLPVSARMELAFRESPRRLVWGLSFAGPVAAVALAGAVVAPVWALTVAFLVVFAASLGVLLAGSVFGVLTLVDPRVRDAAAVVMIAAVLLGGAAGAQLAAAVGTRFGVGWSVLILAFVVLSWGNVGPATMTVEQDLDAVIGRQVEVAELSARSRLGQHLPLLVCKHVDFAYGPVQVLFDVSFSVDDGEMVALLGTNGAGKTTLLRVISGLAAPRAGSVHFRGEDVTFAGADQRVAMGISQIPGGRAVFGALSIADNLRAYGYTYGRRRAELNASIEEAFAALPKLYERRNQLASTLSGGEQQMLGVAKAFVIRPRLLLIDELSLGLAPIVVSELLGMVRRINEVGTAVVLVEQSVNVALSLVRHAYFMEKGEIRFDGPARDLLERPELLRSVFLKGAAVGLAGADT